MEPDMKKWIMILLPLLVAGCHTMSGSTDNIVNSSLEVACQQMGTMLDAAQQREQLPRSVSDDNIRWVGSGDWTSGFFPGCLWYLYEATGEERWLEGARTCTAWLEKEQFNTGSHDVGFMMNCSYGNGCRLTQDPEYKKILLQSAESLSSRFNPKVGCIRSWDFFEDRWAYPVIIDNMMNLELLFWAAQAGGDRKFYDIAVSHADTTLKNHYREDMSCWHVINYDPQTGEVLNRQTQQGFSDDSAWARGQSWGLYGFTMCYRYTRDSRYLEQACKIADFLLNHPNLPEDGIPYWDYNAPNIPDEPRDASAAAIMCSALYELSGYLGGKGNQYRRAADHILAGLASPSYLAGPGTNHNFLLMHSVGSRPENHEVDVPLIYADYYFLEALLRSRK